uniref:rab11 family-interacting protein 5 n=1 Tax=Lonchura striata TaxID=40157 RepID=UPI0012939695|nr:rab11 family-interacting protein 5 [Lonchura striata domestica]
MALLRAAALPAEGCPAWLPTHVQVTVVRARGLRCKGGGKGKAGGSDAYTVIQLGREKYSTSVAEKSGGSPEWREECAFELPPEPGACPGLLLTVMHRALVGMDRFLGQALVALEPARQRGREPDERWHKLHSKAGKKEKERGEILVSIQFTRNSLTASMFDLSAKDKARSPFGRLRDKVAGKKKYELESASAIIPSSVGALDMEDDFELGGKKSKLKGFFLKSKLRKSSLTQSSTSLGSDSTVSSASLSVPEVPKSPSRHGSLSAEHSGKRIRDNPPRAPLPPSARDRCGLLAALGTACLPSTESGIVQLVVPAPGMWNVGPGVCNWCKVGDEGGLSRRASVPAGKELPASPKLTHKRAFSEDESRASPAGAPPSPGPGREPASRSSRSSLCVNGSHVYGEEAAAPRNPPVPRRQEQPCARAPLHPEPQHAARGPDRAQQRDEPRFIPSPPSLALQEELKVSTKAVTLSNHLGRARLEESHRLEGKPKDGAPEDAAKEDKKAKGGFFHHGGGRSDAGGKGQGDRGTPVRAAGDESSKSSGWFGSKEPKECPPQKPSPHPVKPLSAVQEGSSERRQQPRASLSSALSNGLERLKTAATSSVQPLAPAGQSQAGKTDPKQEPTQLDQSAKYYHLTHDELIQLLLQKEGELSKKEEHIHELENYIDQLLVRIMEQSPTLLQIPLGGGQAP